MNKLLIAAGVGLLVILGLFFYASAVDKDSNKSFINRVIPDFEKQEKSESMVKDIEEDSLKSNFSDPKKSAHYESNTPEHGVTLVGVPINVVINFNFDLAKGSEIKIKHRDEEFGVGDTIIDERNLTMRRQMSQSADDGLYTVEYKACWADGSCDDGSFQFKIDPSQALEFSDMREDPLLRMRSKSEVTINLANYQFDPKNIRVSKGTKVIWVNQDNADHTVSTDSHPAHTYYLAQNSKTLKKGESYSVTFDTAGIYPYHCTPHADSMTGSILVE